MLAREILTRIASDELASTEVLSVKVQPLIYGSRKGRDFYESKSQLELIVEAGSGKLDVVDARIEKIKDRYASNRIRDAKGLLSDAKAGEGWIFIKSGPEIKPSSKSFRSLALGFLGGLVAGSGAALIADRRSNRVFSRSKLLGQLGYPLWLALPTLPWSDQVAGPLVGQLAARLDRSLDWRVLSIAREHEAVGSLAQALSRQNEPELSCKAVAPLLNSIIRLGSNSRPIGLLVVVESGFNSAQGSSRSKMSALLAVLKSKGIRPSTFGSWLAVRVGSTGCVKAICISVIDLFLINPSSA